MNSIILEKNDCRILFYGDCIDTLYKEGHFKHYDERRDENVFTDFVIEYTNCQLNEVNIDIPNSFMNIACSWEEIKNNDFIDVLVMTIMQYILQTKGIYVLHSSAVCKNEKSIILWGGSGAGKTSMAIYLCQNYGFKFISNDSTLISIDDSGKLVVVGTLKKKIKFREYSIQFEGKCKFITKDTNSYEAKKTVYPHEIKIQENDLYPIKVDKIFKIQLDRNPNLQRVDIDHYRAKLLLYDELSKVIRGCSTLPIYGKQKEKRIMLNNFDSEYLYKMRVQVIENLVENCLKGSLRGSLKDICNEILKA